MKNWKKSIIVSLLFFFSIANCIETLTCVFQKSFHVSTWDIQSDDKEDKNSESEKTEKFNDSKALNAAAELAFALNEVGNSHIPFHQNFSSSDYSQVIYSPPEHLHS